MSAGKKAWEGVLAPPLGGRTRKPRQTGITFCSAKGLGLHVTRDLIEVAGDFIDRVKLAFGTTLLLDEGLLREQIACFREADIEVNPGGTCGEIALFQGAYPAFLRRARDLGFTTIEVSDGTLRMDDATRERCVKSALDAGFKVISEVGNKDPARGLSVRETIRQMQRDLRLGVSKVVVEARASAQGIGVFDAQGRVKSDDVDRITAEVNVDDLIWEAPTKAGQEFFIARFGNNVNLGNISPYEIVETEGLRQGLRGDTFRQVVYAREGA